MNTNRRSDWARIERSREIRLWITQIGIPVVMAGLYINSNPELKNYISDKFSSAKRKVDETIHHLLKKEE